MSADPSAHPADLPTTNATASPPELAALTLRRFRVIFNAVRSHFQRVERAVGLGGSQAWALSVVADQPGIGVNALARTLDIHQSTASNLVRGLVERGLMQLVRSAQDRRTVELQITPQGQSRLAGVPRPFAGVLPQALAELDLETLTRLSRDLATLIDHLGQADPAAAQKPLSDA
jgi:DNA-binding MarR family transcriptional regulator